MYGDGVNATSMLPVPPRAYPGGPAATSGMPPRDSANSGSMSDLQMLENMSILMHDLDDPTLLAPTGVTGWDSVPAQYGVHNGSGGEFGDMYEPYSTSSQQQQHHSNSYNTTTSTSSTYASNTANTTSAGGSNASNPTQAALSSDKRKKRLARNRASARLRRLRKKNLVESYESEVGVLESSLNKLQQHKWGEGQHEALLEALGMDRGQQSLPREERKALIKSILEQQGEMVENMLDVQTETVLLTEFSKWKKSPAAASSSTTAEQQAIFKEMADILKLTGEQTDQLARISPGVLSDRNGLSTIKSGLGAVVSNKWLENAGVEDACDKFMSILNPTQVSKFLLWTDNNSEAIDNLDYVNAPAANSAVQKVPTFYFGDQDGCDDDSEDEREEAAAAAAQVKGGNKPKK
jgi:hypothetical protein